MKVLHVLKTADGAKWAWRQIRVLKALGVDVEVVLPGAGSMSAAYRDAGIPVHLLDCDLGRMRAPGAFLRASRALQQLVTDLAPDIVHSHFVGPTLLARWALGRNRGPIRIFQVPGPLHLEHLATRTIDLLTAGNVDRWIASCRMTRDIYLAAGLDPARVGLSFYGTEVQTVVPGQSGRIRPMMGLTKSTKLIGMVAYAYRPKRWLGQRAGIKGHEDLIAAVASLRQQGRSVALVFAGAAWAGGEEYYEAIKAYAERVLGTSVTFLGNRNDVMDIYADLDVAVHPSHSENLGGAVESLLAAVPTVATNVGGLPDVVVHGETGWLCSPKSPASLASAIAEALDDPAEATRRALAGRELVKHELDVNRTAAQVFDYYRFTLGGLA